MNEANALIAIGNDDDVITGSDHETPNDTTESDDEIGDDDIIIGDQTIGDDFVIFFFIECNYSF